jgi:hypothetical protein
MDNQKSNKIHMTKRRAADIKGSALAGWGVLSRHICAR